MGSRYKDETPFAFYDPEQDRDGHRQTPRSRGAAPLSPRAQPSGYSSSPRAQPFGHYDPDLDLQKEKRGGAPEPGYGGRGGPEPEYGGRGAPEHGYGGRGAPESARGGLDSDYAAIGASEPKYGGRGAPEPGYGGRGAPEPGYGGRGAPEPGYGGRGAPEPGYGGRGGPEPGYGGRGAPNPSYGGRGGPELATPGRGGPEPGYGGRGAPNPNYGGRGAPGPFDARHEDGLAHGGAMGAGKYVYGGLRPAERGDPDGAPPAPISSEYAHQVYASVFSDPVYGGAGQLNARAGYAEEAPELQQLHQKEDVLRHPDRF